MVSRSEFIRLATYFALFALLAASSAWADNQSMAFIELTTDEERQLETVLDETHFKNGLPRLYRRHRLLRIDTEEFQRQLMNDWKARQDGMQTDGVPIPLFEDRIISVQVDSWIEGGFGVTSGYGRPLTGDSPGADFVAHFSRDGRLEASINIKDHSFLIGFVRDYKHYLVLEMDPWDGPID